MAQDMAFFSRPSPSAVKISAPSADEPPSSPKPKKDSTQRQCRNILIYGSCKFQDKGCIYYHPSRETSSPVPPESPVPSAALPAQAVNAPVFVPKGSIPSLASASPAPSPTPGQEPTTPPPPPSETSEQPGQELSEEQEYYERHDQYNPYAYTDENGDVSADDLQAAYDAYDLNADASTMLGYDPTIDPYYAPAQYAFTRQPLNYHLYTLPRPEALAHRYFISDDVREELTRRVETTRTVAPPGLNLPEDLQGYHSLMPLEPVNTGDTRRQFGNWYSTVYRAVNSKDGAPYALRRIEGFRLMQQSAFAAIEAWSRIHHPNIVSVREAFTTRAFSDSSLVVVHDYHPNARTLYDAHLRSVPPEFVGGRLQGPQIPQAGDIPERTMWSYIIQIANAIRAVHDAGLAVRIVDVTKVIITGKNRVRLSSCGIVDVLMHEARADVAYLQQEDLAMFGKLIFQLGCGKMHALTNLPKAMEAMSHFYSADLQKVALLLVGKPEPRKNIGQVFDMIGNRLLAEMDEMQNAADRLEGELMSELENGRLVRLLCKFGFINERPEFAREPRWSETGDRYIIKLFRDYVFHQVDEHGNPVVNLTHVLTCLNKLDAGTDERIMLVSRDEQSCLVVSYKDIKTCIDSAFRELSRR